MLVTRAKVPGDFYIYRDVDGRLKETKNIVTQLGRAVSDDITLSIAIDDDSFVYVINGNTTTVSNRRNSNFSGKYKIRKQLRRNRRYEIQWYRRRRGRNAWDTAAFSNAMRNGKGRQVAFIEARSVGRFEDGYISYARWSPYAIPTRSGIVRIRKRATEGAPAGRWNYFIVRDLDAGVNEAVRVTKIREDVKRFGFVKRQ